METLLGIVGFIVIILLVALLAGVVTMVWKDILEEW
jgi:hypothetical protein